MWNRIKALFGFAEEVVTLASKHADALKVEQSALTLFKVAVDKLEGSVETLREVAAEAEAVAKEHAKVAETAVQQAIANAERAAKIRDFFLV
jgi:hypothetical protein